MNFKLKYKYNRYLLITFILTFIAVATRTILLAKYFDIDVGYYTHGSVVPTLYSGFICIIIAVFISSAFVLNSRHIHFSLNKKYAYTAFTRAFIAFILVLSFFIYLLTKGIKLNLDFFANIMSLLCAVYFIYPIFSEKPSKPRCAFLCFFPIIWAILNLASVYFDTATAINNPIKITEQLAFMSVMVYFLYECRVYMKNPMPKMHCIAGMLAMLFSATTGITGIISYSFRTIDSTYIIYDLIFTAFFMYISSQFIANRVK